MSPSMTDKDQTCLQTQDQWTRFLSAFTHELRTPLSSLRMLAELLADAPDGHLGAQERRYAENIQEVLQDIQGLVGDVADLSRLVAGRTQPRIEEVSLEGLVQQVKEAVRTWAWERGIALTESLDPALPLLRTDPNRLRHILTSLLGAAVSHAQSEVSCRLDLDRGCLRVVISSNGAPFPEAPGQDLFEPFDSSGGASRRRGGRSLALPLANELAHVLGGTLSAENRGGRPTFALSLPLHLS